MTQKTIQTQDRLKVLVRLLNNNELFDIACSKSGLTLNDAKELLGKNHIIRSRTERRTA